MHSYLSFQDELDLLFSIYIESFWNEMAYCMSLKAFKTLLLLDKQLIIIYLSFWKHINSII